MSGKPPKRCGLVMANARSRPLSIRPLELEGASRPTSNWPPIRSFCVLPDDDDGTYKAVIPARRAVCSHTRWNAVPIENEPTLRLRVLLSRTKSSQVLMGLSLGTMKMNGVRATSVMGCRSF
ncbi:hypothetical protein D3C71_1585370 [compost metagenome]